MKMFTATSMLVLGTCAAAMGADFKGFVEDSACASKPGMKGNAKCAESCIKKGDSAVLVTPEGKVYKIANQDKIVAHAGHNVTITGDVKDDTITVESVAMNQ
jgi:hypothetical protein